MPSNRSISPPKRRAHRSASSSSLIAPVVTTAHVRRLSRVPSNAGNISPSLSNSVLPRFPSQSSFFPITPDCEPDAFPPQPIRAPSLSDHPLSLPRLGAAVDALIRPPAKGKPPRPHDPPALFILFSLFIILFISLIFVLRSFFPSAVEAARHDNTRHVRDNLDRVSRNVTPLQFWPFPDSLQRAQKPLPSPYLSNVTVSRIWDTRFLATRHLIAKRQQLRLSVVAACKDRTAFLQTALPVWLQLLHPRLDEVILVDWGTSAPDFVPLTEVARAAADSRVSVISLTHDNSWVLSRAYNLGFALARGEWVLKLDCDTVIKEIFLKRHPLPSASDRFFYRFDWSLARDRNEEHLNGIFLARTSHLRGVHGYDERITTYGWEDTDLYNRLEAGTVDLANAAPSAANLVDASVHTETSTETSNNVQATTLNTAQRSLVESKADSDTGPVSALKAVPIQIDSIRHMPHDDSLRGAAQHLSMGPLLETQVNSQASEGLPSWSLIGERERTTFKLDILSRDARFLAATVLRTPSALLELVTSTRRDAIVAEAVTRVLHDGYGLPWTSLSELEHSREHVVRVLAKGAHGRGADSVIFSILNGSVPDRIVGLASSILFARVHSRPLFLIWSATSSDKMDDNVIKVSDFFDMDDGNSNERDSDLSSHFLPSLASSNNSGSGSRSYSNSALAAAAHLSSRPIFHLFGWKCQTSLTECASADPAYKTMVEWHMDKNSLLASSSEAVLNTEEQAHLESELKHLDDIVQGQVSGKRNVLLRLHGGLPTHSEKHVEVTISSFQLSEAVHEYVRALTTSVDLSRHIGVYLASSVHGAKQIDAMAHRISSMKTSVASANDTPTQAPYFVTGPVVENVKYARSILQPSEVLRDALQQQYDLDEKLKERERITRDIARQIAELVVLARCKEVVNDGRPSRNVIAVVKAFQRQYRHEQQIVERQKR